MKVLWKASQKPATLLLILVVCFSSLAATADQEEQNLLAGLEGVVIDSRTRQPVADARVYLERGRAPSSVPVRNRAATYSTETDEQGRFRFGEIEPGVYTLEAAKRGYVPTPLHVLALNSGTTTTHDIALDSMAKISGRVVDESNHAVAGARVAAMVSLIPASAALNRILAGAGFSALATTSDGQGEFELFVPAQIGQVTLAAQAAGYASNREGPLPVEPGRERREIVIRLPSGLKASGRVVGEGGTPISAAAVVAHRFEHWRDGLGLEEIKPRATSGEDGSFLLRGLEKGTYSLRVSRSNYASRTVPKIEIDGATNQDLEIVLLAQAEIRGRVTDAAGRPIVGARVRGRAGEEISEEILTDGEGRFILGEFPAGERVYVWAEARSYISGNSTVEAPHSDTILVLRPLGVLRGRVEDSDTKGPVKEFRTWVAGGSEEKSFRSEDGSFEWPGLPPGRWTVVAQAPGYQKVEVPGVEIHSGEPRAEVVFPLRRGVELNGRVLDDRTGEALPDVTVSYRDATQPEELGWLRFNRNTQTTDVDGRFKFDGLPPAKVTITAQSPLYAKARKTVTAGDERLVEIKLSKGGNSLSGRVVASDGVTPVPGAQVSLEDQTSRIGHGTAADGAGVFSFDRLGAGRYRLMASTKFGQAQTQDIVLRENERLGGLVLVITPGATLRGKVRGVLSDERRVVNLSASGHAGFTAFASTDAEGAYAIHGVPVGVVQVTASTSAFRSVSKSIEVPEGAQELFFDIAFPPAARLSGRVTRAGSPVRGAGVSAAPFAPHLASGSGETDLDGMYAIDGLSDGDYVVRVSGKTPRAVRISGDTTLDIELPAHSVSGRVVEAGSGEALAGANVHLQSVVNAVNFTSARSDAMGHFSLEGIESGDYRIVAHKPGFKLHTEAVSVPGSLPELTLPLTRAEGVVIRVRDGISGFGLRTVSLTLSGPVRLGMNLALDETGKGELPQLPPGSYNTVVSASGYASKVVMGWTVPGSSLDVVLTPGGRLEIHVDPGYVGSRGTLLDANGIPPRPDRDPSFRLLQPTVFPHLTPGQYILSVSLPNRTKTYRATISEGQSTVVRVE